MTDLEVGDIVEDRDDDPDTRGQAAVINRPSVPADEWRAYYDDDGGEVTVATDNPDYPEDDTVAVVLFLEDLQREHPDWRGEEPIPLAEVGVKFYSFPVSRLVVVGELETPEEPDESDGIPEELQAIVDRLEAGEMTVEDVDPEGGVVRASKLGEEYLVRADGTVEGGALADRVEDAVREVAT